VSATNREGYDGPTPLSDVEILILKDYILLLQPIEEQTNILSGESYVTGEELWGQARTGAKISTGL